MSEQKESLREFQARLNQRLQTAGQTEAASRLGFTLAGQRWLVPLADVHEVVSAAEIVPVPWARPWFLGLVNVRGAIYGCSDLAAFLGLEPAVERTDNRLLLVHPRFDINAALRVERTIGLRHPAQMQAQPRPADAPAWLGALWRDAEGDVWREIDLEKLVTSVQFLEVTHAARGALGAGLSAAAN